MVTKRTTTKKTASKRPRRTASPSASLDPTLWADIEAIGRRIPDEVRANMPRDAAARFDDYIEGLLP